jgi:hypothetical protein
MASIDDERGREQHRLVALYGNRETTLPQLSANVHDERTSGHEGGQVFGNERLDVEGVQSRQRILGRATFRRWRLRAQQRRDHDCQERKLAVRMAG